MHTLTLKYLLFVALNLYGFGIVQADDMAPNHAIGRNLVEIVPFSPPDFLDQKIEITP